MAEDFSKYQKLTPIEMREKLQTLSGWEIVDGRLHKEFRFPNFARAMIFLNKIVNPIEENQNYPKIIIAYDRVQLFLFTHAAGALTVMDFSMAEEINTLAGDAIDPQANFIKA